MIAVFPNIIGFLNPKARPTFKIYTWYIPMKKATSAPVAHPNQKFLGFRSFLETAMKINGDSRKGRTLPKSLAASL
jgi:hypothetical protein